MTAFSLSTAPRDMRPCSTRRPGIAPEIGLDQRLGDAGQRRRLDGKAEHRHQPAQRLDIGVGETARPRRRPARHEAVHLADGGLLVEPVDHGEIVGLASLHQLVEDRKAAGLAQFETAAQFVLAALKEVVEGTSAPAFLVAAPGGRQVFDDAACQSGLSLVQWKTRPS